MKTWRFSNFPFQGTLRQRPQGNLTVLYRQHIIDNISNPVYVESLHDHLSNMIRENKSDKEQNLKQFVKILKNNNMVFNSTSVASTSTSVLQSSSSETITKLIDDNDSVTPSMPPAEI